MNEEIPELIKQIDIVLKTLAQADYAKSGIDYHELFDIINLLFEHENPPLKKVDNNEFYRIISKLKKDGFVESPMGTTHEITFEGNLSHLLGGYEKQYRDKNLAAELQYRVYRIQKTQTAIQTWIAVLTLLLALGTSVAALYYGIEVWKFYHPAK